jgi:ArpU family phage transcriptional regulator
MYKLTEFDRKEATITQSYTAQESQRTNVTSDQTANVALYNVQEEERRKSVIRRVERAVETKLNFKQRQLIKERYLTAFGTYDRDVYYGIMEISPMTYSKIREQAFLILAATLGIYVKKEETT